MSTCCWFVFETNVSESLCLMDGVSRQGDPYTPPNDYWPFHASYEVH